MDVVHRVRQAMPRIVVTGKNGNLKEKWTKVGHAGTLDPLATGLVICLVGKATKHVNDFMDEPKQYVTTIDLSAFTTTDDLEGEREEININGDPPSIREIESALVKLTGDVMQTPPIYSAVHVGGRRAYKLARQGETPVLKPRIVHIEKMAVMDYAYPMLSLKINCGKGTYIRSIARDLGKLLGTGGHLAKLRRTRIGEYHVDEAQPIERFEQPVVQADLIRLD